MPWHSAILYLAQLVRFPVLHALEIQDTIVIVVLAGEDFVVHTGWVGVGKRVVFGVPSAIAHVQPTNEGHFIVNDNKLLVMCLILVSLTRSYWWKEYYPVKCHVTGVLENIMVRMSHEPDISVTFLALRDKVHHHFLAMLAVACECCCYLKTG